MNESNGSMGGIAVSVVIPACNAGQSLARCIDSVLAQGADNLEVIVVDDGSEDETLAVAQAFDGCVKVVQQKNSGQGAARNRGVAEATGHYLALLDADDYWKPGFLAACSRFLEDHPEAVAVNTAFTLRMRDRSEVDRPILDQSDILDYQPRILDDFFEFWATYDHIRTGTCVMRTEAYRTVGGQREDLRISQDLEFWGMLATVGDWGFIPDPLWVGDSRIVGSKTGWRRKYSKRRRLCPTVEQWESRLAPCVPEQSREHFEIVRGRVAAGYMYAKLVAGEVAGAKHIFEMYRDRIPKSRVGYLVARLAPFGLVGWLVAARLLAIREFFK